MPAEGSARRPEDRRHPRRPRRPQADAQPRRRCRRACRTDARRHRSCSSSRERAAHPPSMKRPYVVLDAGSAGLAAPQAQLERRRARAVGKRRQAGQAAAEEAARWQGSRPTAAAPRPTGRADRPPSPRPIASAQAPKPSKPATPPLAPLGRRERSQLSRGTKEIDARLDLHGMTQTRAHRALLGFLQRAHQRRPDLRARHHRQRQDRRREVRARRAAPPGAAMAELAGIPLAGGRL